MHQTALWQLYILSNTTNTTPTYVILHYRDICKMFKILVNIDRELQMLYDQNSSDLTVYIIYNSK